MQFLLLNFLKHLGLLFVISLGFYILFPDITRHLFQLADALFGPGLVIAILILAALPFRHRRHHGYWL